MRKVLSLILTLVLIFSLVTETKAANLDFKDVPKNHANYQEIMYLLEKGVISPGAKYGINDKVTREEVAIMVAKAVGLDGKRSQTKFKDVPGSRFSSGYINSAVNAGIINGYPDGTFKPKNLVTRGHMAAFIANGFKLKEQSNINFKDVPKGSTAYVAVKKLAHLNITSGYPDGTFKPDQHLTRAHISAFIARAMNPAFRPAPKRKVYLDLVTKKIMLNNITVSMSKNDVVARLGKPEKEYIDFEYNSELVQEYPGMSIYYSGKYVDFIYAKISDKEFFNEILPDFKGRKFTNSEGYYVLYSNETEDRALYKYENGETGMYLSWDYHFNKLVESGEYGEYVEIK